MTRLLAAWSTLVGATVCQLLGHRGRPVGGWELCARCGHYQEARTVTAPRWTIDDEGCLVNPAGNRRMKYGIVEGTAAYAALVAAVRDADTLHVFLDALVLAKKNDDVMSVVDAMVETYVAGQVDAETAEYQS